MNATPIELLQAIEAAIPVRFPRPEIIWEDLHEMVGTPAHRHRHNSAGVLNYTPGQLPLSFHNCDCDWNNWFNNDCQWARGVVVDLGKKLGCEMRAGMPRFVS
jgi:hypothetical protein